MIQYIVGSMQAVLTEARERYPGYNDTVALSKYKEQLEKIASYASDREMRIKAMEKFTFAQNLYYVFNNMRN
jgi:hypothetical protein